MTQIEATKTNETSLSSAEIVTRWRSGLFDQSLHDYLEDHPGNVLGPGMPMGTTLRRDDVWMPDKQVWRGESHLDAWMRIVRADPCAFCGRPAGTVDHIEPQSQPTRGVGSAWSWANVTGACERCNGSKKDRPLLAFMATRNAHRPREKKLRAAA